LLSGWACAGAFLLSQALPCPGQDPVATTHFKTEIRPILQQFCFDCHGEGANKGKVAFDEFASDQAVLESRDLWLKVLKNLRAGLMPPPKKEQPSAEQKQRIDHWIKAAVFQADPQNPDPGRVTCAS
jgi:hypothetical protein